MRVVPPAGAEPSTPESVQQDDLFHAIRHQLPGWQQRAFEEFHGLVRGLLIKALGPRAEIEELVDDVFLSLFESARRIRSADKVRSYVVSITMNRVRTEIRNRRRRAAIYRLSGGADELERKAGHDDPKAKAALIQLSHVLGELSAEDRAAFLLRSVEGLPMVEVARILGISESTAHRRTRRAADFVMKKVRRNALLCDYIRDRTEVP